MNTPDRYALVEGHERDLPAPPGCEWFAKRVEQLGKDCGTRLRMVWAPDRLWFCNGIFTKRYPAVGSPRAELVGWWEGRMIPSPKSGLYEWKAERKRKPNAYSFAAARDTGYLDIGNDRIARPEVVPVEFSVQRWIIEQEIPPETMTPTGKTEFEVHNEIRYHYDARRNILVDALGPWPAEGKWKALMVIAQHWIQCCENATAERRMCWGVGRDPIQLDIEDLEHSIRARNEMPKLREISEMPTGEEIKREEQAIFDALEANERVRSETYWNIFNEINRPAFNLQNPKIVGGTNPPRHRTV